ncbi:MAG: hypothetical protein HY711_01770 [Candidatus Melainabacteria bacterium]|nr:hypothetical protein [Candidatus Melainabacteria bacterium]
MQLKYLCTTLILASTVSAATAGPNDFFGGSLPGTSSGSDSASGASGTYSPPGGDYTDDEKRMQKKYKASLNHARVLIAKGDAMIKKGQASHNDKLLKKGKIIKEIGEKQLTELQANNPFPDMRERHAKSTNGLN